MVVLTSPWRNSKQNEMQIPSTLRQLWKLAGADPLGVGSDWIGAFEPIGLILLSPPRNRGYWCTPVNSLAFATTGGDGVHYSLLSVEGDITDFSPIVMTVPMCDTPNVIVGANLREFLALGCRFGYFSLEQLVYQPERTLEALNTQRFDPEAGGTERALLHKISSHFSVTPWADPRQRLRDLAALHGDALVLPPQDTPAHPFP
jgi:hypothetical protein